MDQQQVIESEWEFYRRLYALFRHNRIASEVAVWAKEAGWDTEEWHERNGECVRAIVDTIRERDDAIRRQAGRSSASPAP